MLGFLLTKTSNALNIDLTCIEFSLFTLKLCLSSIVKISQCINYLFIKVHILNIDAQLPAGLFLLTGPGAIVVPTLPLDRPEHIKEVIRLTRCAATDYEKAF